MSSASDRRAGVRVPASLEVGFEVTQNLGGGRICDLSLSGALIADSDVTPALGEPIKILVTFSAEDKPIELLGKVVRHAPMGCFAVEFHGCTEGGLRPLAVALGRAISNPDADLLEEGEGALSPAQGYEETAAAGAGGLWQSLRALFPARRRL